MKRFDNVQFSVDTGLDQAPDAFNNDVIPLTPRTTIANTRSKLPNAQNNGTGRFFIRTLPSEHILDWWWQDLWFHVDLKHFERAAQMMLRESRFHKHEIVACEIFP